MRWALFLADYNFQIQFQPSKQNDRSDALSRRPDYNASGSMVNPLAPVLERKHFSIAQMVVIPKKQFCLNITQRPNHSRERVLTHEKRLEILQEWHDSAVAGHGGVAQTLELVKRDFWWPGMEKFIYDYVTSCDVCQRNKESPHKKTGLLQPLELPTRPFGSLTTDFIVKLPVSLGHDSILVVVDRFTKIVHLVPCKETINTKQLVELFIQHIFRLHGLPDNIVSDRGPQFRSHFWETTFKRLGIKRHLSSAAHPETDGQTERMNQSLEQYLRCFIDYQQTDWANYLALAEFALNNSLNASTKVSHFFALYGYHPRADQLATPETEPDSRVPASSEFLEHIQQTQKCALRELARSQSAYKAQADKHRQPHQFTVGDQVWLLRRHIATNRPCPKLDNRRLGPFQISQQINDVAFRLPLPSSFHIHDVFHVSLLEPFHPNTIPGRLLPPSPPITVQGEDFFRVREVLDSRQRANRIEYLIDWEGYGPQDRSWEPADNLTDLAIMTFHERFPSKPGPRCIPPRPRCRKRGHGVMTRSRPSTSRTSSIAPSGYSAGFFHMDCNLDSRNLSAPPSHPTTTSTAYIY